MNRFMSHQAATVVVGNTTFTRNETMEVRTRFGSDSRTCRVVLVRIGRDYYHCDEKIAGTHHGESFRGAVATWATSPPDSVRAVLGMTVESDGSVGGRMQAEKELQQKAIAAIDSP